MIGEKRNIFLDASTIFKGLKIAITLSLLFSAVLILMTFEPETLIYALNSLSPVIILEILVLLLINFVAAGLEFTITVSLIGHHISILDGVKLYLAGAFISNVTPMATGGGPFQIYFLHKRGIPIGQSTMVILTKFLLRLIFFTFFSIIFFIFFNKLISPGVLPRSVFYLGIGAGFLIAISLILFSIVPAISDKLLNFLFKIEKLRKFIRKNYKIKKFVVKGRKELREFHKSMKLLTENKGKLALAALTTILYWSSLYMIIPVILRGLGYEPNYLRAYVMQTILNMVIPYFPTPGASGVAELGFASIFVSFIPRGIIGIVTFFWRFVTFYLILIIGSIFVVREMGWKRRKADG
ncbi:MAG: flippase-like domain-containing protein [Halanaerobiaceae bacterium]|nr:flippase-like domain-containing protein [Halanaerobiaceae bacterium]